MFSAIEYDAADAVTPVINIMPRRADIALRC